ncbi:MAG: hypothetical protein ACOCVN_02635, partial [bacterium]
VKHMPANDSTVVIQKADYDQNNNPVAIYRYMDEMTEWSWVGWQFNPDTQELEPVHENVIAEAGLRQIASIEYNYDFKNFFGNTLEALVPELKNYKVYNAPKKISMTGSFNFGSAEYSDFNDGGYPDKVVFYGFEGKEYSTRLEVSLSYDVKQ